MVEHAPAAVVVDPLVAVVLGEGLGDGDVELAEAVAGAALLAVDPAAEQAVRLRAAVSMQAVYVEVERRRVTGTSWVLGWSFAPAHQGPTGTGAG